MDEALPLFRRAADLSPEAAVPLLNAGMFLLKLGRWVVEWVGGWLGGWLGGVDAGATWLSWSWWPSVE